MLREKKKDEINTTKGGTNLGSIFRKGLSGNVQTNMRDEEENVFDF